MALWVLEEAAFRHGQLAKEVICHGAPVLMSRSWEFYNPENQVAVLRIFNQLFRCREPIGQLEIVKFALYLARKEIANPDACVEAGKLLSEISALSELAIPRSQLVNVFFSIIERRVVSCYSEAVRGLYCLCDHEPKLLTEFKAIFHYAAEFICKSQDIAIVYYAMWVVTLYYCRLDDPEFLKQIQDELEERLLRPIWTVVIDPHIGHWPKHAAIRLLIWACRRFPETAMALIQEQIFESIRKELIEDVSFETKKDLCVLFATAMTEVGATERRDIDSGISASDIRDLVGALAVDVDDMVVLARCLLLMIWDGEEIDEDWADFYVHEILEKMQDPSDELVELLEEIELAINERLSLAE
jgi:hypothetical protein